MRPLIKRTFVVKYRKTHQGLATVVIDEIEVKPFASPLKAGDRSEGSSSVAELDHSTRRGGLEVPGMASFSRSF